MRRSAEAAAATLGAGEVVLLSLPDNRFDALPILEIIQRVEEVIARFRPELIYTHSASDLNIDHAIVNRAVVTATRPLPGSLIREVLAFEIASSTEWGFHEQTNRFHPHIFVDVSGTLERKIHALQCYADEMRPFPHPRSREALMALAQWRGSTAGLPAAEAFELIWRVHHGNGRLFG
jgi:LmbE family N-acetylglucosaminyl deacetylase